MSGASPWKGKLHSLGIVLLGTPGGEVSIERLALLPLTTSNLFPVILSSWTAFTPWEHASINSHEGIREPGHVSHPVPVAASLLLASTLVILILWRVLGRKPDLRWNAVATLFLVFWIALDLVWQRNLLLRLQQTWNSYAGVEHSQKRTRGGDSELYHFIALVKERVGAPDGRVFVSSGNDYAGMRGAYYLYPLNVFWLRKLESLPPARYIQPGDYLVLIQPAREQLDRFSAELILKNGDKLAVKPLLSLPAGQLYRVL